MSGITTHVLDISQGTPAAGVPVALEIKSVLVGAKKWEWVAKGETDADGRVKNLLPSGLGLKSGTYRLIFDTATYFSAEGIDGFYPSVMIVFEVRDGSQHYHVPLLLSPYGYSTYRGS